MQDAATDYESLRSRLEDMEERRRRHAESLQKACVEHFIIDGYTRAADTAADAKRCIEQLIEALEYLVGDDETGIGVGVIFSKRVSLAQRALKDTKQIFLGETPPNETTE